MDTIEKRAEIRADAYLEDCMNKGLRTTVSGDYANGYIKGATEQKEISDATMFEEREKAFKDGYSTAVRYACDVLDAMVKDGTISQFKRGFIANFANKVLE